MKLLKPAVMITLLALIQTKGQNVKTSNCGRRLADHNALIARGFQTNHWPWHAAIYHKGESVNFLPEYKCGGTVINENSILTAAHCISRSNQPLPPSRVSVSLGRLNLAVDQSSAQLFQVANIFQYPFYNEIDLVNDIALIRLSTNAAFNNYVQPICLWHSNKTELSEVVGREGTVIGWGVTETGQASNVLRQTFMPVVPSLSCLETNREFFGSFLTETNFCAGFRNGTRTCNGDSGGSMAFEEDGLYYIRGIVSVGVLKKDETTGQFLCDSSQYAIFTDVAQYLTWIRETANECEIKAQCSRIMQINKYVACEVDLNVQISERNCKIFFTELPNSNITLLTIQGQFLAMPDLSNALDKFENLKSLALTGNKLKFIERTKLAAFTSIESLFLGENEIDHLDSDTFDDLKNLDLLDIRKNTLKVIDQDLFSKLSQLQLLWFNGNQLEIIPEKLFWNNNKLLHIAFQNNKIKKIHGELFKELHELKVLYLHSNQFEILPENIFQNNPKLQFVAAQNNKIKEIHGQIFSELHELKWLYLGENYLEILPENIFQNNGELQEVDIQNNLLRELHPDLFKNLYNLKELYLGRNKIEVLPQGLFLNNPQLTRIFIENNKIKTIDTDFQHLSKLVRLNLKENICIDELCDVTTFCGTSSLAQMQQKIWKNC